MLPQPQPSSDQPAAPSTSPALEPQPTPAASTTENGLTTDTPLILPHDPPTADPLPPVPTPEMQHNAAQCNTEIENDPPNLTPKPALAPTQITAISLLISGHTIAAVASLLNLNRCTIHRWKKEPAFAEELQRRIDEIADASESRIRLLMLQTTQKALDSLKEKDKDLSYKHCFRLLALLRPYHNRVLHSPRALLTERVMKRPLPDPLEFSPE